MAALIPHLRALAVSAALVLGASLAPTAIAETERSDTDPITQWTPFIAEAARRFAIPTTWVRAVMAAESGGLDTLNGRPITSSAGAMGLMQLMPETWADMRAAYNLGHDPYDPHDNILAGAAYLKRLFERYGYPGLFAAYNAGPARYEQFLSGKSPLPDETRAYIAKLAAMPATNDMPPAILSGTRLFFTVGDDTNAPDTAANVAPSNNDTAAIVHAHNSLFAIKASPDDQR